MKKNLNAQNKRHEINFDRRKKGTYFSLERPRTLVDRTTIKPTRMKDLSLPKRLGVGNRTIRRTATKAQSIAPRTAGDFDKLEAINISRYGKKVRLTGTPADQMVTINAFDDRDTDWLVEKARLVAIGRPNQLPLSREQRRVSKEVRFGDASLTNRERIKQIQKSVEQGITQGENGRIALGGEIAKVLMRGATGNDIELLRGAIEKLEIPTNYIDAGFTHRFWTPTQTSKKPELISSIIIYTLSNNPNTGFPASDATVIDETTNIAKPIKFQKLVTMLNLPLNNTVYDLVTKTFWDASKVMPLIMNGTDGGLLDDLRYNADGMRSYADFVSAGTLSLKTVRVELDTKGLIQTYDASPDLIPDDPEDLAKIEAQIPRIRRLDRDIDEGEEEKDEFNDDDELP